MRLKINELTDYARYAEILEEVIEELNGVKILRLEYISGYQGKVDIDVLLEDDKIFSYFYSYGSCNYCDDWEYRYRYDYEKIKKEMIQEAIFFDDINLYKVWRAMCKNRKE